MILTVAIGAFAQGFDAERYVPPAGIAGGLLVERAEIPKRTAGSLGVFLDYADDPVVVTRLSDGEILSRPVHNLLGVNVMGSVAFGGHVELAAAVPLVALSRGDTLGALDGAAGLGDVRLVPKFTVIGAPRQRGFRLGFAVPVRLPTGSPEALRGSGTFVVEPQVLLGGRGDRVTVHGSAGFRARPGLEAADPIGDELTFGLGAAFQVIEGATGLDLLLEGTGAFDLTREGQQLTDLPLEVLGGIEWRATRDWTLTAGAGPGLTDGLGTPDFRAVVGIRFNPRADDEDDAASPDDSDRDRIVDSRDQCPKEKEDYDGFHDRDGCPEADNDDDKILDDDDECPMNAEEPGGDGDGCPDTTHVRFEGDRIEVDGKILFAFDSDEIDRRSYGLIDEIAKVLKDHPEIGRVYVRGHTDNVGEDAYNIDLSQRRANSVRAALVKRGIDADRLLTKGYGERRPIAPNDTPAGRAQNRRVEFLLKE